MVQFDYKGEKGYGHVIESEGGGGSKGKNKVGFGLEGDDEDDDVLGMEGTGEKGGGEFPRWVCIVCLVHSLVEMLVVYLDTLHQRSSGMFLRLSRGGGGDHGRF